MPMQRNLLSWIGLADLQAAEGKESIGSGPVCQAVQHKAFDAVVLLSDHQSTLTAKYLKWLKSKSDTKIHTVQVRLSNPMQFGEIYEHAVHAIEDFRKSKKEDVELVFHLSPGTPAMAAVWILLAKTRYPAELIQSSKEHGVQTVKLPFDISADYIPDLLKKPDDELVRLSQGLPPEAPEFDDVVHRCLAMKRLVARARRVAPRAVPVLLLGESGTGKELLARAIHNSSTFRSGPFVPVNCGAIPHELVESELFGHEKGAFTGATSPRAGYIESAAEGTLFLDEVGELPLQAQVRLLRVLQDGRVTRIGSTKPIGVKFRVVAATNRDLFREVSAGKFREDLFHRIAVAVLQVPPLREREGDLNLLIDILLDRINQEASGQPGFEHKKLSVSARKLIAQYDWPGNVRELHNTLQRAAVWSTGPTIDARDIKEAILPLAPEREAGVLDKPLGNGLSLENLMSSVARHYLQRAMEKAGGNKTKAAELVGLPSYQTLTNWLKRYGIARD